jgi:dTDP-4-amino-4,6-dideoxygalactose transaminase
MIPLVDLKAQYQSIKAEINAEVGKVLEDATFILGPAVKAFEETFAAYCHNQHCVAVNSGTSALHLALLAAGIGAGDEVITVPFTFVATVAAIEYAGARPVFVDIDPVTYTMDPAKVEAAITPRTKALMPVHLYGHPADMDPLLDIARRRGLVMIEDAAQAHGAEYKGRRAGSLGEIAAFSFYPGKNLGAYGEGGAVVTGRKDWADRIRLLRDWGAPRRYHHELKAFNYRMEGIQGAILNVKMKYIEQWTEARRQHAADYDRLLASADVQTPTARPDSRHVFHIYAVRSANRDVLAEKLTGKGIGVGLHYPFAIHELPAYADLGYKAGAFPESERAAREELSLPMYPELSREQLQFVAGALNDFQSDCERMKAASSAMQVNHPVGTV